MYGRETDFPSWFCDNLNGCDFWCSSDNLNGGDFLLDYPGVQCIQYGLHADRDVPIPILIYSPVGSRALNVSGMFVAFDGRSCLDYGDCSTMFVPNFGMFKCVPFRINDGRSC